MSIRSAQSNLISSLKKHPLMTRILGTAAILMTVVGPQLVLADCGYYLSGGDKFWTCSGTVEATLEGTSGGDHYRFYVGVVGMIKVISNGGYDSLDFYTATKGVTLDLSNTGWQTVYEGLQIMLQDFDMAGGNYNIAGSNYDDVITGGAGNDYIGGMQGNDVLNGGAGNDSLSGREGNDIIEGGAGTDTFDGYNSGVDITLDLNITTAQDTGEGSDTITGIENVDTGEGNDTIIGDGNNNRIRTSGGNDTISGGGGNDNISSGQGSDSILGGDGVDYLFGGDDDDNISGGAGNDYIDGGAGDDIITGGAGGDSIIGNVGTDTRADTTASDCVDYMVNSIETDKCPSSEIKKPIVVVDPVTVEARVPELCLTGGTQVTLEDDMLLIFSDFRDTPNGMIISQIPLRSLRAPSDEEKASGQPILAAYKESEFAPGWSVAVYWQNEHYGVVVYSDGGQTVYEDTGAICGWS